MVCDALVTAFRVPSVQRTEHTDQIKSDLTPSGAQGVCACCVLPQRQARVEAVHVACCLNDRRRWSGIGFHWDARAGLDAFDVVAVEVRVWHGCAALGCLARAFFGPLRTAVLLHGVPKTRAKGVDHPRPVRCHHGLGVVGPWGYGDCLPVEWPFWRVADGRHNLA